MKQKTVTYAAEFIDNAGSTVEIRADSVARLYDENRSILPTKTNIRVYRFEYLVIDGRPHLKSKTFAGWISGFGFFCE